MLLLFHRLFLRACIVPILSFILLPGHWLSDKVVSDKEVPGSIPDCAVEFFYNEVLLHGMYGMGVSLFQCPLFIYSLVLPSGTGETLKLCLCF